MPIRKFRSAEAMNQETWRNPGDPELFRAIASVWEFAERTCPRQFPPGVYKHRTIEDAKALRERWEAEDFRVLWEKRGVVVTAS